MRGKIFGIWGTAVLLMSTQPGASGAATAAAQQATPQDRPTFSVQVDLVTTDLVVRDGKGNFISDLTRDEFEVYEDGVKQDIVSITLSHGGRVSNVLAPPPASAPEGIILPPPRRTNDVSGRIFVFFIDDLHIQFQSGPRVRALFKKISNLLLHDGDMFGIVSSGTSSISIQLTYDKKRIDDIIEKISGDELKPSEIINGATGTDGPAEVRHRARVAMDTVTELLNNLEKIHDRRKSLVYISDGYDFKPFQNARLGLMNAASSPFLMNNLYRAIADQQDNSSQSTTDPNPSGSAQAQKETFTDADLGIELAALTLTANRANTTIYTIDPRGLVGMPDLDEPVEPKQWSAFIRRSQDTLRELAEETGGIAVVNQNDFDGALKRIDADSSDYYVLGYYSNNPDPKRRVRRLEVRTTRKGIDVMSRREYLVKPVPAAVSSAPKKPAPKK